MHYIYTLPTWYSSQPLDIVALRTGHIIEAQLAIVAWPLHENRWRISLVIRKILLLDNEIRLDLVSITTNQQYYV